MKIQLSQIQNAAIEAIARKLRMTPKDAFKTLAFMPVGMLDNISDFRDLAFEVAEPVLAGGLPRLYDDNMLAGCIEFDAKEAATA